MGYTDISFLDTKKEHDRWHHGLYRGLKTVNPKTLRDNLRVDEQGWRKWYAEDNHYHDLAMCGSYLVSNAAVAVGAMVGVAGL